MLKGRTRGSDFLLPHGSPPFVQRLFEAVPRFSVISDPARNGFQLQNQHKALNQGYKNNVSEEV
jgi:hypothetical protein